MCPPQFLSNFIDFKWSHSVLMICKINACPKGYGRSQENVFL